QAEDGIRGYKVTGVQTCALPIFASTLTVMALRQLSAAMLAIGCEEGKTPAFSTSMSMPPKRFTAASSAASIALASVRSQTRPRKIGRASCRERVKIGAVASQLME